FAVNSEPMYGAGDVESFLAPSECLQLTPGTFTADVTTLAIGPATIYAFASACGVHFRRVVPPNILLVAYPVDGALFEGSSRWARSEVFATTSYQLDFVAQGAFKAVWIEVDVAGLTPFERSSFAFDAKRYSARWRGTSALDRLRSYVSVVLTIGMT